jgi:heat shock protein HslJ
MRRIQYRKLSRILINFCLLVAVCACTAVSPSPGEPSPVVTTPTGTPGQATLEAPENLAGLIEGTEWVLVSMRGRPPVEGSRVTLSFQDGNAGGLAGCNYYGADYTVEGNRIRMEMIEMTSMLCEQAPVMDQESAYIAALTDLAVASPAGVAVTETGGRRQLEIRDTIGQAVLVYVEQPQLEMDPALLPGTTWRLAGVSALGGPSLPPQGPVPTLHFVSSTEISGFAGCRHYYGSYLAAGGDAITVHSSFMLGNDCSENQARTQDESMYMDILSRTTAFALSEDGQRLDLRTAQGDRAAFFRSQPVSASLEGTNWRLAALFDGPPNPSRDILNLPLEPLPGTTITLGFDGETAGGRPAATAIRRGFAWKTRLSNSDRRSPPECSVKCRKM